MTGRRFQPLVAHAAVVGIFLLAWHASALFEVRSYVSALYLACGVTFSVALMRGWRYLPTLLVAAVLAHFTTFPGFGFDWLSWGGPVRHTVVYALAGLSMRRLWLGETFRLSLPIALRFLVTALVAALLSASLAIHMAPFNVRPAAQNADVFFSILGGDFAGVMVTVPILLMMHRGAGWTGLGGWWSFFLETLYRAGLKDVLALSGLAQAVTLMTIFFPMMLASSVRVDMLTIIPVLLAGLWRGALTGFLVSMQVSFLVVLIGPWLGISTGLSIDIQLLIAINAAVALLGGAAHDDRQHEWRRASYDALTGLVNYSYFIDQLERELQRWTRSRLPMVLLYVDLDGFKTINDTYGHAAGDRVLKEAAQRMRRCTRQTDIVARMGGDEFAILLIDAGSAKNVERVAASIIESLAEPIVLDGRSMQVSASVGIAMGPHDGLSPLALVHMADQAMYRAKMGGKNRFCLATEPEAGTRVPA